MEHSFNEATTPRAPTCGERVNREFPDHGLRWTIAHVNTYEPRTIDRMKALGVGGAPRTARGVGGTPGQAGPPYRCFWTAASAWHGPWTERRPRPQPLAARLLHGHRQERRGDGDHPGQQITSAKRPCGCTPAATVVLEEENTLGTIEPDVWPTWRSQRRRVSTRKRCRTKRFAASSPCSPFSAAASCTGTRPRYVSVRRSS